MSEETQGYLDSLDETHNPDSVNDDGFARVPDNDYQVRLDKLYISRANKGEGRVQCVFEFEVIVGDHAFRKINKYSGMDTAAGLDFLTRDLRKCGIDHFKWSNVELQFPKALDKLFLLNLKTKTKNDKQFQGMYILKELNRDEIMVSKTLANEDVPF